MTVRDMRSVHAKVAVLLLSLSAVLPLLLGVFMASDPATDSGTIHYFLSHPPPLLFVTHEIIIHI